MNLTPKQELMVFTFKGLNQLQLKVLELQAGIDAKEDATQSEIDDVTTEIKEIVEVIESLKGQMRIGFEAILSDPYDPQNAAAVAKSNSWLSALTGE